MRIIHCLYKTGAPQPQIYDQNMSESGREGEWKFRERVKDSLFSNQWCRLMFTSDWKFSKQKKKGRPICQGDQGGLQKMLLSMAWNANEEGPGPKGPTFRRRNNSSLGQLPRGKYDYSAWYFSLRSCERLFYTSNPDMIQENFKRMVLFFCLTSQVLLFCFFFSMEKNMLAYATCHLLNVV